MTPHAKLKAANGLMLLGSLLIPLSFYRFLTVVSPASHRMSVLGEGLMMLGAWVVLGLVIGMSGFVWSLVVEKRHPSAQVAGTFAIRIVVFMVLFAPLVFGSL